MPSGGLDPASAAAVFTNTTISGNMDYSAPISYCASNNNNLSSTVSSPSSANAKDTSRMLKHFKLCTLNIHSLLNASHSAAVADLATSHDLDLIALTKTWIKPNSTVAHLADSTPPGYSLYSNIVLFPRSLT